jgi:hypothetical protein
MDFTLQQLSRAETGAVDSHLGTCEGCRALLEEERALGRRLAAVPRVEARSELWAVTRALAMEPAATAPVRAPKALRRPFQLRFPWPAARPYAAAFAAGVATVVLLVAPNVPAPEAAPGARVIAQTLDQARQVARQSDDPMGDMTDRTWEALTVSHQGAPGS